MYGVRLRLILSKTFTPCRVGRRSPPAASFASARPPCRLSTRLFFSDGISAVQETQLQPKRALQAEQEGAFFSSESAEKNRTGWFGQSVSFRLQECQTLTDGSAKACLLTAGMPT